MSRTKPTMSELLDAALLALMSAQGVGYDRNAMKLKPAGYVRSLFDFDHWPTPVALGGSNHATNLQPRIRAEHRTKTATKDIPAIAKVKRVSKAHEEFRARMLAMKPEEKAPAVAKAKIANRGFDKRYSRKMNGQAVRKQEA